MTWLRRIRVASILVAGGGLALAHGLNGLWQWSWIFVVLSLAWWRGQACGWQPASAIGIAAVFVGAVLGIWLGAHRFGMLLVTGLALIGWDLDGFEQRLWQTEPDPELERLVQHHLIKLGAVVLIGIGLSGATMVLRARLNFWLVLLVGLILAISLSRAFQLIGRQGGEIYHGGQDG
jgi:hypothetical protein